MSKIAKIAACLLCLLLGAWTHGSPGRAFVLDLSSPSSTAYPFLNFFKACTSLQSTAGYGFPGILSADGYPTSTPSNAITCTTNIPATASASYVVEWTGQGALRLTAIGGYTVSSDAQSCVQGATTSQLLMSGTNCRVVFTFGSSNTTVTAAFPASGTFSGMSGAIFSLLSNESAITGCAAAACFNPDFLSTLSKAKGTAPAGRSLNPKVLRFIEWNNATSGNTVSNANIAATTAFSYTNPHYDPAYWTAQICAQSTGNTGSCPTGSSSANLYLAGCSTTGATCACPGGLTTGLVLQGILIDANTSSTVSINYCGLGAKTVVNQSTTTTPGIGGMAANAISTFTYDAVLGEWIWSGAINPGLKSSMPTSVMTALCNAVQADCWIQILAQFDDASVTSFATAVATTLNSNLNWYIEYSNEVWNFANTQTGWMSSRAIVIGFPNTTFGSEQQVFDYYALRRYQVMQLAGSAWTTAGRSLSNLKRVESFQSVAGTSQVENYRMLGKDLTLDGTTNCGGLPCYTVSSPTTNLSCTAYGACGSVGGTASQGCPVCDKMDLLTYAPYYNGAQISCGSNCGNAYTNAHGFTTANMALALTAADNYANGSTASALAFVDNDIRSGTLGGTLGGQTLLAYQTTGAGGNNWYSTWDVLARKYSTALGGTGPLLGVVHYEGGYQGIAPTASDITTMQLVSTNCTDYTVGSCLANEFSTLLTAYKNNTLAIQIAYDQFNQFMGYQSSLAPSWFEMGPDTTQWSLMNGTLYTTPWQFYFGLANFSGGYLLNRDLDPASNDNSPVGLNKAA